MNVKEMLEKRGALVAQARELMRDGAELNADDQRKFDTLMTEATEIKAEVDAYCKRNGIMHPSDKLPPQLGFPGGDHYIDDKGKEVKVLRRGESFGEAIGAPSREESGLSVGRAITAMVTRNWDNAPRELAATQRSGDADQAGYLLDEVLSSQIIDLARNEMVTEAAGAMIVPMTTSNLTFAKVTGDPTTTWRHEGVAIPEDTTFAIGRIQLQAKTLATIVPVTVELMEDARNIGSVIEATISKALALELDRVVLRGGGSGNTAEPTGVRYQDNVNEIDASSAEIDYDDIVDARVDVLQNNGDPRSVIWSPSMQGVFDKKKDGQGLYLVPPPSVGQMQKLVTNQIPETLGGSNDETEVYVGDFSTIMIGLRKNVTVEVFRSGTVGTKKAVDEMLVFIRAHLRADVHYQHPEHLTRIINATYTGA